MSRHNGGVYELIFRSVRKIPYEDCNTQRLAVILEVERTLKNRPIILSTADLTNPTAIAQNDLKRSITEDPQDRGVSETMELAP